MTVATPPVIVEAFAKNGTKNTIPVPSQILVTPGAASFNDGFPPLTMTPIASGGVPFFGADVNGILNMISAHTAWQQGGGQYSYDSTFSSANTGYGLGALLQSTTDPRIFWSNRSAGNTNNPDSSPTNWQAVIGYPRTAREVTAGVTPSDVRYSGTERVEGNVKRWGCVCDGTTDDTTAFQHALDSVPSTGGYLFIPSDMKLTGAVTVSQPGTTIEIQDGATVTFVDGNYIGFNINAAFCTIRGGLIYSSNTTTPLVTLIKVGKTGTPAPVCKIQGVYFAYASKCVVLANTYITKLYKNSYNNADVYVTTTSEGSSTDITLENETFGTSTIGTSYLVDLKSNGTRVVNCYWETQQQVKGSLIWRTGCQYGEVLGGNMMNSGGYRVEPSNSVTFGGGFTVQDCYDSVHLWTARIDGSAKGIFSGVIHAYASPVASIDTIQASGTLMCTGSYFLRCTKGIQGPADGSVTGNVFDSCTTGMQGGNSTTALISSNVFSSCTTGVIGTGTCAFMLGKNKYSGNTTNITSVSTMVIEERNSGVTASVADGGTITHGHPKAPTSVQLTGTGTDIVNLSGTPGSTTFTVSIKTGAGAPGSTQTINWTVAG